MTNSPYQPLFDKLDATIATLEDDPGYDDPTVRDAVDLLKRLGIVAASLLNGSVAAFAHLILEADPTEQNDSESDTLLTETVTETESDGDEEGQEPSE